MDADIFIRKIMKYSENLFSTLEFDKIKKLLADAGVNDFKNYNEKYKDRHLLPEKGHKYLL